jgi:hypothetical protein
MTAKPASLLDKYFYFFMSLLIAAVVVCGFSQSVNENLLHPTVPRPFLLSIHAVVFCGWVVFYVFQSALVRTHNVLVHRLTGWFGVALGVVMPVLGILTAIAMYRFKIHQLHYAGVAPSIVISFFDMTAFTVPFVLAVYWRKKPEFHRRLMLLASCALSAAAIVRFPFQPYVYYWFYAGVDLLILLGVARDLIVNRRVHPVYIYALPAFILCQVAVEYIFLTNPPYWQKFTHAILG